MKVMSNHFKLVFYCALFNLLFEYSARGIREFTNRPLFVLALFGIYFTYFAMLEDLIVRLKLTNYQILLTAFLYGLFPTAFLTGNLFNRDIYGGIIVAGINVGTVVIIGILAWGVVQGMITLYLANRLSPRDWDHPKMGRAGWALAVVYQLVVTAIAQFNPCSDPLELDNYDSSSRISPRKGKHYVKASNVYTKVQGPGGPRRADRCQGQGRNLSGVPAEGTGLLPLAKGIPGTGT